MQRLVACQRGSFGPVHLITLASGALAALAIVLPRYGGPGLAPTRALSGWSAGYGVLGASVLIGIALMWTFGRRWSSRTSSAVILGAMAALVLIVVRLATIPRGGESVDGVLVRYGPRVGIWVALVAGTVQALSLLAPSLLIKRSERWASVALRPLLQVAEAMPTFRIVVTHKSRYGLTPEEDEAALRLLAACSDMAEWAQRGPRRGSNAAYSDLGAAAHTLRNAGILFQSLRSEDETDFEHRLEACRSALALSEWHLEQFAVSTMRSISERQRVVRWLLGHRPSQQER